MITELLVLSISYERLNDCRKQNALCNARLRGWHGRAELCKERNVLRGEALQCLTASRAKPQGTPAFLPLLEGRLWHLRDTPRDTKISHRASVPCHFTKVMGNLVAKRQTVQIVLSHCFLNCLFSDSAALLPSRDEDLGYFLTDTWERAVVPWSYYSSLRERCQRETAHYSALANIVKCTGTTCNRVSTVSIHWSDAIRAAVD